MVTMPKRGLRAVDHDAVEPVGAGKGERGIELVFVQPLFLVERLVGPADVQPAGRHLEIVRQDDAARAAGRGRPRPSCPPSRRSSSARPSSPNSATSPSHRGRNRGSPGRPDGFSTGMQASMKAYSDWWARVEDLQVWSSPASSSTPPCGEVPAELPCLNTSPLRSTPGPLPYHMAKTPSYLAPGNRLTCWVPQTAVAPSSSLIAGLKADVVLFDKAAGAPQRLVEPAQRRAAIAGDEAAGVEPGGRVALALHHRQAHQRLGPGQVDAPLVERVFVVEGDRRQRHCDLPKPPLSFDMIWGSARRLLNERGNRIGKTKGTARRGRACGVK